MGYYSNVTWETIEEPIEIDEEALEKANEMLQDDCMGWVGFKGAKLTYDVITGFDIELDEYYGKFYDSEAFAHLLASVITKGELLLVFSGEDGAVWGYFVMPKKVVDARFRWEEDHQTSAYKDFEELERELKEEYSGGLENEC